MHMIGEKQKKGNKNMRIAKKLGAVVAMAAVCLTTIVPTTVSAAECPPHYMVRENEVNTTYNQQHGYLLYVTEYGEEKWANCVMTISTHQYDLLCKKCKVYKLENQGPGTVITHSDCGL